LGRKTQEVLRVAMQCGRGQGKVQQMRSWCGQRTEDADAVWTEEGIICPCRFYSAVHNFKNIWQLVKQGSRTSD